MEYDDTKLIKCKILIEYENIMKNIDKYIIKNLLSDTYRTTFSDFLNLEKFDGMNDYNIELEIMRRQEKNIFKWLSKKEIDYDGSIKGFKEKDNDIFFKSELMKIGKNISKISSIYFIEDVIIYSREYDKRIAYDITRNFEKGDKIEYVTGKLSNILSNITNLQTVYINDVDDIKDLVELFPDVLFAVPTYGYNFNIGEEVYLKYNLDSLSNIGTFPPIDLSLEHFTFG